MKDRFRQRMLQSLRALLIVSILPAGMLGAVSPAAPAAASGVAPVASGDLYATAQVPFPFTVSAANGVLANDTDVEADVLTASVVTNPSSGNLTLNPDGSFTYLSTVPVPQDSFTYKANDGTSDSNVATVTINFSATARNDAYTTPFSTPLNVAPPGVLGNDLSSSGLPLTATLVTPPTFGLLSLLPDGSFSYLPFPIPGTFTFTYTASDGVTTSAPATVSINVTFPNTPPLAQQDFYPVTQNLPLSVAAPGVLVNDLDAELNTLTAIKVTDPAHGTVALYANGSFTYDPTTGYSGPDSFTYKANDGTADSSPTTVSFFVSAPPNLPPIGVADAYAAVSGVPLTVIAPGVLGNDVDLDGNPLTAVLVTNPTSGTLTLNPDGSFTYTSNVGFTGPDAFSYKANDGTADSNIVVVPITVEPAPNTPTPTNTPSPTATTEPTATVTATTEPSVTPSPTEAAPGEDSTVNVTADPRFAVTGSVAGQAPAGSTFALGSAPTNGTASVSAAGQFTYVAYNPYLPGDQFTIIATAPDGGQSTVTVVITYAIDPNTSTDGSVNPGGGNNGGGGTVTDPRNQPRPTAAPANNNNNGDDDEDDNPLDPRQ